MGDDAVYHLQMLTRGDARHETFNRQRQLFTHMMAATAATQVAVGASVMAGAVWFGLAGETATLLAGLGIDQAAFTSGSMVAFEQPGLVGFAQMQGSRLVAGIFSINAPGQGVAMLSQFRSQAILLAKALGATEVELVGAEFTNSSLRAMLIRQGFVAGTMEAPAALGGGIMNVLSKVIGL